MSGRPVCVIGSSHAVCMRRYFIGKEDGQPDWYVTAGKGFLSLKPSESGISTDHPGAQAHLTRSYGDHVLRFADHEAFIIIGEAPRLSPLVNAYQTHRLFEHDGWRAPSLMSRDCFDAILHRNIQQSVGFEIVKTIRAHTDAPVTITHLPLPTVSASSAPVESLTNATRKWLELARHGFAIDLLAANMDAARAVFEPMGVRVIGPPAETITKDGLCDNIYMKKNDYTHKNARYGELMWRDFQSA